MKRKLVPKLIKAFIRVPHRKRGCVCAVIAAAGDSTRFGEPKPFVELNGKYLFEYSLSAFLESPYVSDVILTVRKEDKERFLSILRERYAKQKIRVCLGGKTRDESTLRAFKHLYPKVRFVAFHDAARPLITTEAVNTVIEAAFHTGAASAASPVYDSVKRADLKGNISEDVDRENLYTVSTPQVFLKDVYEAARAIGTKENLHLTDDNAYVTHAGFSVKLIAVPENRKLTVPEDLPLIRAVLESRKESL